MRSPVVVKVFVSNPTDSKFLDFENNNQKQISIQTIYYSVQSVRIYLDIIYLQSLRDQLKKITDLRNNSLNLKFYHHSR